MPNSEEVVDRLRFYFPKSFMLGSNYLDSDGGKILIKALILIESDHLSLTHLNQCLHLSHQAGVSKGFYRYYFLTVPTEHTYPVEKLFSSLPKLGADKIVSFEQLVWGIHRFFVDALLYFGNVRAAFRNLRNKSYKDLEQYFGNRRYATKAMSSRSKVFPFKVIPIDDRYLIAEVACKAYKVDEANDRTLLEEMLLERFKKHGKKSGTIGSLFDVPKGEEEDPHQQMMLKFAADEISSEIVESEKDIKIHVKKIAKRFSSARKSALVNTQLYLSIVNELDVYVATSMRKRSDFREMARDGKYIFEKQELVDLQLRYFDPTMSAADGHEDKGLIECLMVKCARALLYFAGDKDSFGKDAEAAIALSLGKPVIILCPIGSEGEKRAKIFKEIHPLSRLIHIDTGVSCGAIVTQDRDTAAELLRRIFCNEMEYDLDQHGDGYFRLKERITKSVVRLQTNSAILREAFWNYYHNTP